MSSLTLICPTRRSSSSRTKTWMSFWKLWERLAKLWPTLVQNEILYIKSSKVRSRCLKKFKWILLVIAKYCWLCGERLMNLMTNINWSIMLKSFKMRLAVAGLTGIEISFDSIIVSLWSHHWKQALMFSVLWSDETHLKVQSF